MIDPDRDLGHVDRDHAKKEGKVEEKVETKSETKVEEGEGGNKECEDCK